jgi:hypothetical protein
VSKSQAPGPCRYARDTSHHAWPQLRSAHLNSSFISPSRLHV